MNITNITIMNKISIAIATGGDSSESEIALKGAKFYESFLDKAKYDITIVSISKKRWYAMRGDSQYEIDKNDFSYIVENKKHTFDFAIIIIHGTPGENGILQSYFELIDMPYATGGVASSVVSFDKEYCKAVVKGYGVKVADGIVLHKNEKYNIEDISRLGFPMFIKPNASGSSFGVSMVKSKDEITKAIEYALSEDDVVLIEKAIKGREVSCGVYSINGEIFTLPPTEIITDRDFFDYEAKYNGGSSEVTPADLPKEVIDRLNENTAKIYKALRCRSIIRIDYIIENEEPYMIEVNNIPGMSPQSIIPQQTAAAGIDISNLYDSIITDLLQK